MPKPQGWVAPKEDEVQTTALSVREAILPAAPTNLSPIAAAAGGLDVMALGKLMAASGFFADAREAAQACVKILAGQELGIGPVAAMTGIFVIQNRVTLSANLMAALVKRSRRYDYRIELLSNDECRLAFTENGERVGVSTFTMKDAQATGKAGGQNWKAYPRNMLFARALSNGVRWFCPDLTSTPVYTADELASVDSTVDATGEVMDRVREESREEER